LGHILSSYNAPDDALLRWTLAKRKIIIQKYGTYGGYAYVHVTTDDNDSLPTLEDCTCENDDTEVGVP
jgi:hypothetical protein